MLADLQETDRPRPTVLNQLITMIFVDNDVRNQSWFVVTVGRWSKTNWFLSFYVYTEHADILACETKCSVELASV